MHLFEAIDPATIKKIVLAIKDAGGEAYIVGGAVRDKFIPGQPASKDIDFLVTGLERNEIVDAVSHLGKTVEAGAAFGVVTGRIDGEDFDFAIPRAKEEKTGVGHAEFDVETDPYASAESDLARRDFTINAMLEDPLSGEIIDPFGGKEDLAAKVIRTVGDPKERFKEDPLRMLRAIQFAARFGFTIEDETAQAIGDLADTLKSVSGERVMIELQKAWTKGGSDTQLLVDLLDQLGIGDVFFGSGFNPIPVQMGGSNADKELGNFVAFFINGGDYKVMKPPNEFIDHLKLTRAAVKAGGKDVWKWSMAKQWVDEDPGRLSRVSDILSALYNATGDPDYGSAVDAIEDEAGMPLTTDDLDIDGHDLMALGIQGRELGIAMRAAMEGIYAGDILNEKQAILDYVGTDV